MKMWTSLVLIVVMLSSLVTWIGMKIGSFAGPIPTFPEDTRPNTEEKYSILRPRIRMIETEEIEKLAYGYRGMAGDSTFDVQRSIEFPFRNFGNGPLVLTLDMVNGGYSRVIEKVEINGREIKRDENSSPIPPDKEGKIKITWTSKADEMTQGSDARNPEKKYYVRFRTNDKLENQVFLEVRTKIGPKEDA